MYKNVSFKLYIKWTDLRQSTGTFVPTTGDFHVNITPAKSISIGGLHAYEQEFSLQKYVKRKNINISQACTLEKFNTVELKPLTSQNDGYKTTKMLPQQLTLSAKMAWEQR